jgi:hypothetical protein
VRLPRPAKAVKELKSRPLAVATELTFAGVAVVAAQVAAAAVMVAKCAPQVAAALAAEAVEEAAPGSLCQPYSALLATLLDQCFAAMRPSRDSFR